MSFKRREVKGKIRPRKAAEEHEEEEEAPILDVVKEIRFEQATRRKGAGVVVTTESALPVAQERSEGSTKRIDTMMSDQFSALGSGRTTGGAADVGHQKVLNEFLNERLGVNASVQEQKPLTEEDKLYHIPDHLRFETKDTSQEEGGLSWNAGIAEVSLPIEYKIRNIEATEAARKRLETDNKHGRDSHASRGSTAPGNLSANFAKHRREWIQDQVHKESGAATSAQAPNVPTDDKAKRPNHPPEFHRSTDDLAVDRFIKKQRRLR